MSRGRTTYPNAGDLQRATAFRLTGNPSSEDDKVARAKACTAAYHAQLKRERFDELKLLGIQKLEPEQDGDPDEWMIVRQCDRCPSSISKIVDYDPSEVRGNPRKRRPAGPPRAFRSAESLEARAQFFDLIRDPDPAAMLVAQDLVLEHGFSLAGLSQSFSNRDFWAPHVAAQGLFWISPFGGSETPTTNVTWIVAPTRIDRAVVVKSWTVEIEWQYRWKGIAREREQGGGVRDSVYDVMVYRSRADARRAGAADAWAIALVLKRLDADGVTDLARVRSAVAQAFNVAGEAPPELYGKKKRKETR